jgi:hypothetical protein
MQTAGARPKPAVQCTYTLQEDAAPNNSKRSHVRQRLHDANQAVVSLGAVASMAVCGRA